MAESIITYDNLYEILRREKYMQELQELDKGFFKNVVKYLKEKRSTLKSHQEKESVFAKLEIEKIKKQIENIGKILKELYEKRETKIIQLALMSSRIDVDNKVPGMLPEEEKMYKAIIKEMNFFRKSILFNILSAKIPSIEEKPKRLKSEDMAKGNKLIKILNPVPKFVGTDLKIYGPLEKEDVCFLPLDIADLLIKNKRAEEVGENI